jgi:MFS family permease
MTASAHSNRTATPLAPGGLVHWTSAQRWVLGLTGLASLLVVLDTLVVTTALSVIRLDLGASVGQLEWTVNAYVLSFAVLLLPAAALGDRFGRRRLFVTGLGVFAAA